MIVAIRCTAKHEAFLLMVRGASNVIKVISSRHIATQNGRLQSMLSQTKMINSGYLSALQVENVLTLAGKGRQVLTESTFPIVDADHVNWYKKSMAFQLDT